MSSTQAQTPSRQRSGRPARGNRTSGSPRGANNVSGSTRGRARALEADKNEDQREAEQQDLNEKSTDSSEQRNDLDLCFICAEPVKYYSVAECNHRTCHICSLRLRALYKRLDCTFCKEPQPSVIYTTSPDAPFSSFKPESMPGKDKKLSIFFETQEMQLETLILLRFNCPDTDCDYIGTGWDDLKLHVRGTHGKLLCDLCLRHKKVFAHEHMLYPPQHLPVHLPSMHQRASSKSSVPKDKLEGGVHPLCEFCRECFFSEDELFAHLRERHEDCFICKRNGVRDQYFRNYEKLEQHFTQAHHPCTHPQCLAQKFVVFNTPLDLQAHVVEEHGGGMTARDKKDARRVAAEFEFEDSGLRGRSARREKPRELPSAPSNAGSGAGPSRPNGRPTFGTQLTPEQGGNTLPIQARVTEINRGSSTSPASPDVDPVIAEHAAFLARIQNFAPNSNKAVSAIKASIRGYRASETSARDLISTIWNVLDTNLDQTASVVSGLMDLLEDEDKKRGLLTAWNAFKIEQRAQFPELVPTATGSDYASITYGRVINVKHATSSRSSSQSSRQVWDRVARAAGGGASGSGPSSSSLGASTPAPRPVDRFPALPTSTSSAAPTAALRPSQRRTPWTSASSTPVARSSTPPLPSFRPVIKEPAQASSAPPVSLSSASFPQLPSSSSGRPRPVVAGNKSLKNILGEVRPPPSVWTSTANGANVGAPGATPRAQDGGGEAGEAGLGKGKKGKGKQKQTLFTLGSFPTV